MKTMRILGAVLLVAAVLACAGCGGGGNGTFAIIHLTQADSGHTIRLHVGQQMDYALNGGIGVSYNSTMNPEGLLTFQNNWSAFGGGAFVWTATTPGQTEVAVTSSPVVPNPPVNVLAHFTVIVTW